MTSPWVRGTKAPVGDELDVVDLPVEGALPPELNGRLDRAAPHDGVRWHEIDPCWVFHPLNAHETEHGVVVDVCQFDRIMDADRTGPGDPFPPQLWRWTVDRRGGPVRRELIDDRVQEFPRLDDRYWGRQHRFGLTVELLSRNGSAAVLVHDLAAGTVDRWEAEPGHALSEAVFTAGGPDAGEGEGWVLVVDSIPRESSLVVLDATAVDHGPVARIRLPQRIPDGFHGDWIPDAIDDRLSPMSRITPRDVVMRS